MRAWPLAVLLLAACAMPTPTPARPLTAPPTPTAAIAPITAAPTPSPVLPQPAAFDPTDPRSAVAAFLRAWQGQDFAAMAGETESSLDADPAARAKTLRAQFDFKALRGAEVLDVDRRDPAVARVAVRVWYEFPPGRLQRKRLAPTVLRSAAGTWRLNASSVLAEQEDP